LAAALLVVRSRYLIVMPRLLPTAPRRCRSKKRAAEQGKYYRLYLNSGKETLATIYLRRVRVVGRCFAASLAHVSADISPIRTRTQGHAPVWGSEFTTKAAALQGGQAYFVPCAYSLVFYL
jgi:hypothetical protein